MAKQQLYPKTKRTAPVEYIIYEKIDGANISIFNYCNTYYVCSRNYIFTMDEILHQKNIEHYFSLSFIDFIRTNYNKIQLHNGSCIHFEWIDNGKIDYGVANKTPMLFAKSNVIWNSDEIKFSVDRLNYNVENLKWSFIDQQIPSFFSLPTEVERVYTLNIDILDDIYDQYVKEVDRKVEGFIVFDPIHGTITKYVRYNKYGKFVDHYYKSE